VPVPPEIVTEFALTNVVMVLPVRVELHADGRG
jgi:hypothetical protein